MLSPSLQHQDCVLEMIRFKILKQHNFSLKNVSNIKGTVSPKSKNSVMINYFSSFHYETVWLVFCTKEDILISL